MADDRSSKGAQTVDRALSILEQFTFDRPSTSLTELSELTGLTVSTTYRLLKALEGHGYVVSDPHTHRYSVGVAPLRLAGIILDREDLQTVAIPYLREIRDLTSETTALHWLVDHSRVPIIEFESPHPMRMTSGVGRQYPLYLGAAGKAILAFVREEEFEEVLALAKTSQPGVPRIRSTKALRAELQDVRQRGYAVSRGEVIAGATALACPVREPGGHALGSVNVTGPAGRWTEARIAKFAPRLTEIVMSIEAQLGYRIGKSVQQP